MDFRLLGPLEVHESGRAISLGGPKQRALLAILLLNANDVTPAEELMRDLWVRLPETADNTLHAHISRLRKVLGQSRIVTKSPGYVLRIDEGERDVERFEVLASMGRDALAAGDVLEAGRLLRDALALWRGPPLADLEPERFASAEVKRLEEEHVAAVEDRIEADLAAGRHAELVPELEQLTVEHALRERLHGQLMLALYRCSRQADALDVYRSTRKTLVDELGIEPSPALRRLETAILLQDPTLEQFTVRVPDKSRPNEPLRIGQSPLVGREAELAQLNQTFESVKSRSSCHLVTLIGSPGIGKSRIAQELLLQLRPEAETAGGRCMPHGEGSALGPLIEIVREIAGDATREAISQRLGGDRGALRVADRLTPLVSARGAVEWEDVLWATRKFLETVGQSRPLVIVFDDVHWANGLLLDLIDHLTEWSETVPMLLLCLARHELLDHRPTWGGGKPNAVSLTLDPLSQANALVLLDALPGARRLEANDRARILEIADGNPLFIEEMLALASERPEPAISIPSSIRAILAARLGHLSGEERLVLARAAVIGREPSLEAIEALTSDLVPTGVMEVLRLLVRRDFLRPGLSPTEGQESFWFRHVLVRDAAYESLPRKTRAELHEKVAQWLQGRIDGEGGQCEQLVGHHLEQAYVLGRYLGTGGRRRRLALARRAAVCLASGRDREVGPAGIRERVDLLTRAICLLDNRDKLRPRLVTDIGVDLEQLGEWEAARSRYLEALRLARAVGDNTLETYTSLLLDLLGLKSDSSRTLDDALTSTEQVFKELDRGKAGAYTDRVQAVLGSMYLSAGQAGRCEELLLPIVGRDTQHGTRVQYMSLRILLAAWMWGPRSVEAAIPRCEELLTAQLPLRVEASAYRHLAVLRAMQGDFDLARLYIRRDQEILEELGLRAAAAGMRVFHGVVELLADEPKEAEHTLRTALAILETLSERWYIGGIAVVLGQALYAQGLTTEAWELLDFSDRMSARDGAVPIWTAAMRGKILASRGDRRGIEFATRAVALSERTDHINEQANAVLDLGIVMSSLRRNQQASTAFARAARLYSRKGNTVMASRAYVLRSESSS